MSKKKEFDQHIEALKILYCQANECQIGGNGEARQFVAELIENGRVVAKSHVLEILQASAELELIRFSLAIEDENENTIGEWESSYPGEFEGNSFGQMMEPLINSHSKGSAFLIVK